MPIRGKMKITTARFQWRSRKDQVHNLQSLNQICPRTSSAPGLSPGSYFNTNLSKLSAIFPCSSLNSFSIGFSLSNASSSVSLSANIPFPGLPPTMELYNLPDARKYFSYRGHARIKIGGRAPRRSIMSSRWASSRRSGDMS